jgi:AhpD family alkylhydroperoxidase
MARLPRQEWQHIEPRVTSRYSAELAQSKALPELYAVLGNSPEMLSAWVDFAWTLRREPKSSRTLRELMIVHTGQRLSAPYCVVSHLRMASEAGATSEQLVGLTDWRTSTEFDEVEQACLALTDAMIDRKTTDDDVDAVRRLVGDEQTIELVLTVAFYIAVAAVTTSLDLSPGG